jgi:hypothetical protein
MDVSNNGGRPQPTGQQVYSTASDATRGKKSKKFNKKKIFSLKTLYGILLVGIAVIIISLIAFIITSTVNSESSYVNKSQYQAVFVNVTGSSGGQAYFGHIQKINSQYIELTGVFYLEPGSSNNQFTLNNLSCALYNPNDTMIINRAQVAFWENLKSNSQVTTDINKWNTDNLQCSAASATSGSSTTTPTTTTTPKK